MKTIISIIIYTLLVATSYAQNIAKDKSLQAGFYKTIEALIDNSPSKPFNYAITNRQFTKNIFIVKRDDIL